MLIKETRPAIWLLNLLLCIVQVTKGLCRPLPVLSLCLSDAEGGGAIELVKGPKTPTRLFGGLCTSHGQEAV